jgi:hypothetical protein
LNVEEALSALSKCGDPESPVLILRKDGDLLTAAPALGVALDESSDEVSILIGDFLEEEAALEGAVSVEAIRDALEEILPQGAQWSVFSTPADDPARGGSVVGFSVGDEVEIFAFLQGPKSEWEND